MKSYSVFSGYRQFYVADSVLDPDAPEKWTAEHVAQRHNTLRNITALCPEGDITARVISCGPGESTEEDSHAFDFEVQTEIEVTSGKVGIFGWPRELCDEYSVAPGIYRIVFRGYKLDQIEQQEDFYVVHIEPAIA